MKAIAYLSVLLCLFITFCPETALGQTLHLPGFYRPVPRVKGGNLYGNLASTARRIQLDEAIDQFRVDGRQTGIAIVGSGATPSKELPHLGELTGVRSGPDDFGLGTHLAGLIGANGVHRGLAPEAVIYPVKIVDASGLWTARDLLQALKTILAHAEKCQIRVVLLALSDCGQYPSTEHARRQHPELYASLAECVQHLRDMKVVVIAPAGDALLDVTSSGLAFPAMLPGVVSCTALSGALDSPLLPKAQWFTDRVDNLPILIAAPGEPEFSTGSYPVVQSRLAPGTMQAAAIVSGTILLAQQFYSGLVGAPANPDVIIRHLTQGAADEEGSVTTQSGIPEVNVLRSIQSIRVSSTPSAPLDSVDNQSGNLMSTVTAPLDKKSLREGDLSEIASEIGLAEVRKRFTNTEKTQPLTGEGCCIAILGGGISQDHPDFRGRVLEGVSLTGDATEDWHGYTTFIAGIVAAKGRNQGIAPAAKIVPVKIMDDDGHGLPWGRVNQGLEWVLENEQRPRVSVVLIPLGGGQYTSAREITNDEVLIAMQKLVQRLREKGIVVIAPAGNVPGNDPSMSAPAIIPEVFSVSASEISTSGEESLRVVASYSQRLPEETDIFAPGGPVASSSLTGGTTSMRGTGMSSAVVAGATLLLQDFYRRGHKNQMPTANLVESYLKDGAGFIGDDSTDTEYLRLNILGSIRKIQIAEYRKNAK